MVELLKRTISPYIHCQDHKAAGVDLHILKLTICSSYLFVFQCAISSYIQAVSLYTDEFPCPQISLVRGMYDQK